MAQRAHSLYRLLWLVPIALIAGLILWLNSPARSRLPQAGGASTAASQAANPEPGGTLRAAPESEAPQTAPAGIPGELEMANLAAQESGRPQRLAAPSTGQANAIRVRVELLDGTPQPGVSIFVDSLDESMGPRYLEQLTDARGLCSFQDLAPGRWRVSTPLTESKEIELLEGSSPEVLLQLRGRYSVSGRVAQRERRNFLTGGIGIRSFGPGVLPAGSYVEGATIYLLSNRSATIARSDAEGRFSTPPLPYGATLYASAPGYEASNQVQVYNAQTYVGLNLIRGGSAFRGRVLDAAGEPVPFAQVAVNRWPRSTPPEPFMRSGRNGLADAEGNFAFGDLWRGTGWIQVSARGFATHSSTIVMNSESPVEKDYTLRPEATLEGRVLHDSPRTPRNVLIYSGAAITYADPEGAYALRGLAAGRNLVNVSTLQHGSVHASLELRAGETNLWNPKLPPSLELRGKLVNEAGEALAGWSVMSQNHLGEEIQAYSIGSGYFSLVFLHPQPVELRIISPDYGPEPLTSLWVELPREDPLEVVVETSLLPSLEVSGTLLDQREFQGEYVRVELVPVHKAPNSVSSEGQRASGAFRLGPVVAGEHHVILEANDYTQYAGRVQVDAESTELGSFELFDPGELTIECFVAAELEAKVSDALGRELESWSVEAEQDSHRLEALGRGSYTLTLSLGDQLLSTQSFEVHSGQDSTLRIRWP